ncbi:MmoB/DmpM family protein [Pseudonocardia endophytica]|uniref:Toluene monooxygenase system protein D n=1 Tax=Pseudonocardia endophytica TaxID=401976 RepID=A0A4R1IB37_PSEEN|nr:MmoB/DmpM family protein [Pseudonocardia endophytica]TCK27622.1 toluene monooxygenase system protein D [Pseudonocardia endophytica]
MDNAVGPILRMCDEVELVAAAIEDDNPDKEIEVIDRGSYVRIHASDHLRVTAESLKRHLGDQFEIRSLEAMMSAFSGRIQTSSDSVEWSLGRRGTASTAATR